MDSVQEMSWRGLRAAAAGASRAEVIKENRSGRAGLGAAALAALCVWTLGGLLLAVRLEQDLPVPRDRTAPPDTFSAERARDHLVNLTALGPRVTGSYENEVSAVGVLLATLRQMTPPPGSALRVDVDVHKADGAAALTFLDGMSNIYRGVQSVVARVSAAGGGGSRPAVLLNCHYDTVPDSAGAADDAAGCAVLLETTRALLAAGGAWRWDLLLLMNGAEESIMQASHAFVTQHPWAKRAKLFVNLEACGAGGREVLFQSTPGAGRLLRLYQQLAPRPYASSLAQEIFDSGLVPGDTDFRIFRDYGNMAGVDLAWSADGYAYHTALDAAPRVPPAALQRTGDNVLALVTGLLTSETLFSEGEDEGLVYFDALGLVLLAAGGRHALLLAAGTLLLVSARLHYSARDAHRQLMLPRAAWYRVVLRAAWGVLCSAGVGLLAALLLALALHVAGLRLSWYARPWLLAPLYGAPALAASAWWCTRRAVHALPPCWRARAACDALCTVHTAGLLLALVLRVRSGYVPAGWALALALADLLPRALGVTSERARGVWWLTLSLAPALQGWYVCVSSLAMFAPVAGRAGTAAPPDLLLAALLTAHALPAAGPALACLPAARLRHVRVLLCVLLCGCALGVLLAALAPPYTVERPQRYMVFHVRTTRHATRGAGGDHATQLRYWLPALDVNTPHSVYQHVPELRSARAQSTTECARDVYCGAPYYLPVLSLVPDAYWLSARAPPAAALAVSLDLHQVDDETVVINCTLTGPAHIVVIVSPAEDVQLVSTSLISSPQEGPRWLGRRTYLLSLGDAAAGRAPARWALELTLRRATGPRRAAGGWAALSLAGHAMFGAAQRTDEHQRLIDSFPPWTQVTGWGVDQHLYTV